MAPQEGPRITSRSSAVDRFFDPSSGVSQGRRVTSAPDVLDFGSGTGRPLARPDAGVPDLAINLDAADVDIDFDAQPTPTQPMSPGQKRRRALTAVVATTLVLGASGTVILQQRHVSNQRAQAIAEQEALAEQARIEFQKQLEEATRGQDDTCPPPGHPANATAPAECRR